MVQLHVVVRRTFLEIEDADEFPMKRDRAFSDTCLFDADIDTLSIAESVSCDQCTNDSTSAGSCAGDLSSAGSQAGDDTPRNQMDFSMDDEVLMATVRTSPVWMPVFAPVQQEQPKQPEGRSRHQWPTKACKAESGSPKVLDNSGTRTTMMLRNLPSSLTRANLLDILDDKGLGCKYDFVYLPIDFVSGASLGYAFVNFVDSKIAHQAINLLHGFNSWAGTTSVKIIEACWSDPHQGLKMLVERFRNSRVMHGIVPDEYRPALFSHGSRLPFPKHTKRIRPPYSGGAQGRFSAV